MKILKTPKFLMLKPSAIYEKDPKSHNEIELETLLDSITANGIIEPLLVAKDKKRTYRLISGSKRLFCAKTVGMRRIPCIVYNINGQTSELYNLICALCRYEIPYMDQAELLDRVLKNQNLDAAQIAIKSGLKSITVKNKLKILELPYEIKKLLTSLELSEACARIITRLPTDKQELIAERAIKEKLSSRELQVEISKLLTEAQESGIAFYNEKPQEVKAEKPKKKSALKDVKLLTNSILRLVGSAEESGIKASFKTVETEKYTEYKIRINKNFIPSATQLKIV